MSRGVFLVLRHDVKFLIGVPIIGYNSGEVNMIDYEHTVPLVSGNYKVKKQRY